MKTFVYFVVLGFAVACKADTLVVPSELANVEGNTEASLGGFNVPIRTQQVYSSSLFSAIGPEGANISELRFRIDGGGPNGFSTTSELEVRLSSTRVNEETLNSNWQFNVGADETVVLPRSPINLSSGYIAGGPNAFSIVIPFPTQFHYSPSNGNLLVDIFAYEPGQLRFFDAQLVVGDGLGIVRGGIGSPFGGTISSGAFITQLTFVPVPEPQLMHFLVCGSMLILALRWRKYVIA
jgi:hypothetical protein